MKKFQKMLPNLFGEIHTTEYEIGPKKLKYEGLYMYSFRIEVVIFQSLLFNPYKVLVHKYTTLLIQVPN